MTPELKELKAFLLLQLANPVIATAPNDPVVKAHVERIHSWIDALSQAEAIPVELFDGFGVYNAMTDAHKARTSYENVSDTLDSAVKLIRAARKPA